MKILCDYCQKISNSMKMYQSSHCKSVSHIFKYYKYYEKFVINGEHSCAHKVKFGNCSYGTKCNLQFVKGAQCISTTEPFNIGQLLGIPNKNVPVSLIPIDFINLFPRKIKYYYGKGLAIMKSIGKRARWDK